jgi:hypothetical protein
LVVGEIALPREIIIININFPVFLAGFVEDLIPIQNLGHHLASNTEFHVHHDYYDTIICRGWHLELINFPMIFPISTRLSPILLVQPSLLEKSAAFSSILVGYAGKLEP